MIFTVSPINLPLNHFRKAVWFGLMPVIYEERNLNTEKKEGLTALPKVLGQRFQIRGRSKGGREEATPHPLPSPTQEENVCDFHIEMFVQIYDIFYFFVICEVAPSGSAIAQTFNDHCIILPNHQVSIQNFGKGEVYAW